jgi:hypothetical protein
MGRQLVTAPQLKHVLENYPPGGGMTRRELVPDSDFTLSYGLAQLPMQNVGKRVEVSVYQQIDLAGGASQNYQISGYLQSSYDLLLFDFDHMNPLKIKLSSSINTENMVVESGGVANLMEDGLQATFSLLVTDDSGPR